MCTFLLGRRLIRRGEDCTELVSSCSYWLGFSETEGDQGFGLCMIRCTLQTQFVSSVAYQILIVTRVAWPIRTPFCLSTCRVGGDLCLRHSSALTTVEGTP